MNKKVPVYFYYLDTFYSKLREDGSTHSLDEFITEFSNLLSCLLSKELIDRKHNFTSDEKVKLF